MLSAYCVPGTILVLEIYLKKTNKQQNPSISYILVREDR